MQLYGKPVLNIDKGTLSIIPVAKPDDFVIRAETAYTLRADGTREAQSTLFGAGIGADLGRTFARSLESRDGDELAQQQIRDARLEGTGRYTFPDPREPSGTFTISAPFEISKAVSLDRSARIRMLPLTDPRPSFWELITGNVSDKAFHCMSLDASDTASLSLPDGTYLAEKPGTLVYTKDLSGQTSYGPVSGRIEISGAVTLDGRVVRSADHLRFVFDAPVCPREFAGEIKRALARWHEFDFGAIGLTPQPVSRVVERGPGYEAGLKAYRSKDYALALKEWMPLAKQGNVDVQVTVGSMYAKGNGVSQDYLQAFEWYNRAAQQGYALAQSHLGFMHYSGLGIPRDYGQALAWYRKAADQGDAWAQEHLAMLYAYGHGVPPDHKLAAEWFRKAAEQGFAAAQYDLGYSYEIGFGVDADNQQAMEWYRKAANQGHAGAQDRLNSMNGTGGLMNTLKGLLGLRR
jgi:hypothetical protein